MTRLLAHYNGENIDQNDRTIRTLGFLFVGGIIALAVNVGALLLALLGRY